MVNMFFFVLLCLVTGSIIHRVDALQSAQKEDLELERQLKLINKPPIKSIHTNFGYIIDCIDINKQPAFDHPLLKNHKLQRKPSFQKVVEKTSAKNSPTNLRVGLEKYPCPKGTIPIRRTTKDDLIRVKSLLNNPIMTQDSPGTHVARLTLSNNGPYYGVSGTNSVYNPKVDKDQTSAAHIWVQNGESDGTNKIVIGWHVSPQLYGDDATHLYATWTSDNFKKTGCYNILCSGFVQINKAIYIGARVANTSVYGGDMYELPVSLSQDPATKNWWVNMLNQNIGYFPASIFSNMTTAGQVGWGGRTTTPSGTLSPHMGSGHFPDGIFVHACYFRHIDYQVNNGRANFQTFSDNPNCYKAVYYGNQGGQVGYSFQFGGPGGDCGI